MILFRLAQAEETPSYTVTPSSSEVSASTTPVPATVLPTPEVSAPIFAKSYVSEDIAAIQKSSSPLRDSNTPVKVEPIAEDKENVENVSKSTPRRVSKRELNNLGTPSKKQQQQMTASPGMEELQ